MTSEVVGAHREMSFKEVARLLDRHRISGLPVVDDDDKVVGVISGTDLLRLQAARSGRGAGRPGWLPSSRRTPSRPGRRVRGAKAARTGGARATTVGQLMSTPAITVHPEQRVADAARIMERHRVERLPVVDEEDRLIGIATRSDLLRVFLRTDEEIRREVADDVLVHALSLPPHSVTVSVDDGVVTLEGQLQHRSRIPEAIRLTWRVDGVVGVMSGLTFRIDDTLPVERHAARLTDPRWMAGH
ncbi:hypothetical protein CW362_10230 [Streptomyces populi]|uniref:CBS domain-containing protein n=2 Tax=Streptomyces populi TaxID=2058924 RepID=A0A2I0STB2_9ACTN|nr:hypothetical protein CW362_10230 [Streptomyces populi]